MSPQACAYTFWVKYHEYHNVIIGKYLPLSQFLFEIPRYRIWLNEVCTIFDKYFFMDEWIPIIENILHNYNYTYY